MGGDRPDMKISEAQTKKLMEFNGTVSLKQLALKMTLTRFKGIYKHNPSDHVVAECTNQINEMFDKFGSIMQSDYEWIVKL
ncbi:MAG: hypothetical protein LBO03_08360 [Acidaminococcales bacterium]|jgi:hypothetical protein|nr:hypothetical protein [Acidaminococcales bacterium]